MTKPTDVLHDALTGALVTLALLRDDVRRHADAEKIEKEWRVLEGRIAEVIAAAQDVSPALATAFHRAWKEPAKVAAERGVKAARNVRRVK